MPRLRAHRWLPPIARLAVALTVLAASVVGALAQPAPVVEARPQLNIADARSRTYWTLNETSGGRADQVPVPQCGSSCALDLGAAGSVAGKIGNAAHFTAASTQYLGRADSSTVSLVDDPYWTLAGWVYLDSKPGYMGLVSKGESGANEDNEYQLYYNGGTDRFTFTIGNGTSAGAVAATALGSPATATWYFIVAWYDPILETVNIQVNNGTVNTQSWTGGTFDSTGTLYLGRLWDESYLDGRMDEWGAWKEGVLTSQERTDLYNAGAGCTYDFAACDSGYVAPTSTPVPFVSGNALRNGDFNIAPRASGAAWSDINRVVQAPLFSDQPIENMPEGSCGPKYWVMSTPAGEEEASFWQSFNWNGGQMFINLEALTNSYSTRGQVSITSQATGEVERLPTFTNGSFNWQTFKWSTASKPAGVYRLTLDYEGQSGGASNRPGVAVDNVNVRRGYWGHDCPVDDYTGQIPPQLQATATPLASITPDVFGPGQNMLTNCGFEQGWSGWAHNAGSRQFLTGGATGPTYAYLHTLYDNGSDVAPIDIPGHIWQPFEWEGGRMYVTYFTGPGTRVSTSIRNLFSGAVYEMQSAGTVQSFNGWTKRSYSFVVSDPGQYVIDARSPNGQIAALDGFTVASGTYATGPCANLNSSGDNSATATAHATSSQIAATNQPAAQQTAHAVQTTQAAANDSYLTAQYATMTQNAANTQTALPPQQTATKAAQQTATAQGTPVPTATRTPNATEVCVLSPDLPICWVVAPVTVVVSDADLTLTAIAVAQTLTAQANAAQTQFIAILQTQQARAQATQYAAQTQTQAPTHYAALTQIVANQRASQTAAPALTANAAANQTAIAATLAAANANATATAVANGINAQATQNAAATQHAQQAAATQTAAAQQTEISGGVDPLTQAAATTTAQAHATTFAGVTATANAQLTAGAISTINAQATQAAQATANSAATAVSLATQNAQQAQATTTAAALQTQLADSPDATAEAQATTTAQAHATTYAQVTTTAQAQQTQAQAGTQIAQGTQVTGPVGDLPPVDVRPEPQPNADCIRPSSPLQLANWIDYEVCRVLTWFAWSPTNTAQMQGLTQMCEDRYPCGLMLEVREVFDVFIGWAQSIPCAGGFCGEEPLTEFNITARGILLGEFDFSDAGPSYGTECDLLLAPIVGPAIQAGACFCLNVMCALGILPWTQLIWNIVMAFALALYVQRTWFSAAHT